MLDSLLFKGLPWIDVVANRDRMAPSLKYRPSKPVYSPLRITTLFQDQSHTD